MKELGCGGSVNGGLLYFLNSSALHEKFIPKMLSHKKGATLCNYYYVFNMKSSHTYYTHIKKMYSLYIYIGLWFIIITCFLNSSTDATDIITAKNTDRSDQDIIGKITSQYYK